jgi:hypothetical protein
VSRAAFTVVWSTSVVIHSPSLAIFAQTSSCSASRTGPRFAGWDRPEQERARTLAPERIVGLQCERERVVFPREHAVLHERVEVARRRAGLEQLRRRHASVRRVAEDVGAREDHGPAIAQEELRCARIAIVDDEEPIGLELVDDRDDVFGREDERGLAVSPELRLDDLAQIADRGPLLARVEQVRSQK